MFLRKIYNQTYLIIPIICINFYALICLFFVSNKFYYDFEVFYNAGRQVFLDPAHLYDVIGFYYMPNFAILFAVSFSLMPFIVSYYLWFFVNYISAIFFIIEFNKVLNLMDIKKKSHRFLFLIIISNGMLVYHNFFFNQSKYLVGLILLVIVRRELVYKETNGEFTKDIKYFMINYGLFIFILGLAPYFIFLLIIYFIYDIRNKEELKNKNLIVVSIIVFMFIFQNFLFIIYPSLIFEFINGFFFPVERETLMIFYLQEFISVSSTIIFLFTIIIIIILSVITLLLVLNKSLEIHEKFSYFSLGYLFFGMFSTYGHGVILLAFILLLFTPHMDQKAKATEFIKSNKIFLIGLISIAGLFFVPFSYTAYRHFPLLKVYPFSLFFLLRWIFFLSIMTISLIVLKLSDRSKESLLNE